MAVYTAVLSGTIEDSDAFEFLSGELDNVGATAVPPADSPFESSAGVPFVSTTDIDPQAWLADVLARIAGHPASRIDELLPWNWRSAIARTAAAA